MPYEMPLPKKWAKARWKVKIFDGELLFEEPHITIVRGKTFWRISLRSRKFMDRSPPAADVPRELLDIISESWGNLAIEWNRRHAANPV